MPLTTTSASYTVKEAAEKIGISHVTVWRAIKDGKLPHRKHGRSIVIESDDLLDYVLAYRQGKGIEKA